MNLNTSQVVLSFTKDGSLFIGKDFTSKEKIIKSIKEKFNKTKTEVLFLRADYGIKYGRVAKLMSFLKRGGIGSIALVTELEDGQ